jgi:hypothetical protein
MSEPNTPVFETVSVGGRIVNVEESGIFNAQVMLINQKGDIRYARTNPFGYFNFKDVPSITSYAVIIYHKRYIFASRTILVNSKIENLDFHAAGKLADDNEINNEWRDSPKS